RPLVIPALREDASFRTNLALVHPGADPDPVTLRVTVVNGADGSAHALPDVTLARGGWTQLGHVLRAAGLAPPAQGWARVERVSGTSTFFAYAVVNHLETSDGLWVSGRTP